MKRKSEVEMEQAKILKVGRALIRLKHSIRADEEINQILPDTLAEYNEALQNGELLQLRNSLDDILGEV